VECKDVDRASFTANVERGLRRDRPSEPDEASDHQLDEARVSLVDEPVKPFAVPQEAHIDAGVEVRGHTPDRRERHAVGMTALEAPDNRSRHASSDGELRLRQPAAMSQRPYAQPETHDVHPDTMPAGTSPALTARIGRYDRRMRGLAALFLAVAVLGSGTASCAVSCPTALLEGVLVADGQGGLAVQTDGGPPTFVVWPDWHGVRLDARTGALVVTGPLGMVVAREGDHVRLGGGENPEGRGFKACGGVALDETP
jgi:hypothetical protein